MMTEAETKARIGHLTDRLAELRAGLADTKGTSTRQVDARKALRMRIEWVEIELRGLRSAPTA